ncbi:MAG: cytochrome c peroxidase [Phenylobacterium sp.]|jgi:cytochrome c peroxidase
MSTKKAAPNTPKNTFKVRSRWLPLVSILLVVIIYLSFFGQSQYQWQLPDDMVPPVVPKSNPISQAKVDLGRHLFYDKRLSANDSVSCATCHLQEKAFTDGEAQSTGLFGDKTPRNSMNLTNIAYNQNFTWANPLMTELEHQARLPLFGETPAEMGLAGVEQAALEKLKADHTYQPLFEAAFADQRPKEESLKELAQEQQSPLFSMNNVINAIASFERTLLSFNSPYDQYLAGQSDAIDDSAKRGMKLFFSERTECFHCHGSFNFSDSSLHQNTTEIAERFHNNGLYNVDGNGAYPKSDRGLFDMTSHQDDMGKFKAPTLRNIAVTAPFMHDGSIATLEGVIEHYANGGTDKREGKNKGFGSVSPYKSQFVSGFTLNPQEKADLLVFLHSLTDDTFLTDPQFSDPWVKGD